MTTLIEQASTHLVRVDETTVCGVCEQAECACNEAPELADDGEPIPPEFSESGSLFE